MSDSVIDKQDASVTQRINEGVVQLTVSVSSDRAAIAEPIRLTFDVETPASITVTPPVVGDAIGDFSVTQRAEKVPVPVTDRERRLTRFEYTLESLASGSLTIPPIQISYQSDPALPSETVSGEISSRPISVTIQSELDEEADPRDFRKLKGAVTATSAESDRWLKWPLLGSFGLMIAGILVLLHRRRRSISADRWAQAEIDKIAARLQSDPTDADETMSSLVDVLRKYIGFSQRTHAMALSSEELIELASKSEWPDDAVAKLRSFLVEANARKYARKWIADDDQNAKAASGQWISDVRELIRIVSAERRIKNGAT